jgi:hypothetical protein
MVGLKAWGSERLRSLGILEVEDIVVVRIVEIRTVQEFAKRMYCVERMMEEI